jgi:hypothetical protein
MRSPRVNIGIVTRSLLAWREREWEGGREGERERGRKREVK